MRLESDYDSAFYTPAGYREADLEMAALEAEGTRRYRLLKWATPEQKNALEAGGIVNRDAVNKETGEPYVALARLDTDAYTLSYSVDDGATWHRLMSEARKAKGS